MRSSKKQLSALAPSLVRRETTSYSLQTALLLALQAKMGTSPQKSPIATVSVYSNAAQLKLRVALGKNCMFSQSTCYITT